MKIIDGGVTWPKGFQATGAHIGIKRKRKDLALLYSEKPAYTAATFTTNVVKAAPVLWNQEIVEKKQPVQAIVVNSGNANACTGNKGMTHTEMMAEVTGDALGLGKEKVLVASTGVIGVPLPIDLICRGIKKVSKKLGSTIEAGLDAAEGIMTTDTFSKEIAVEFNLGDKQIKIGGMAKGSGMIHPNMATMLSFVTTDINISRELLEKALKESVEDSYNMISVDGDTSTNDMVIVLSNGMAENSLIEQENEDYFEFKKVLHYVNTYLAQQIVRDGEGASKFLEIHVAGAATKKDAKVLSKSILSSNLVKTAFFGEDANWGRILAAMGYSGVVFDPSKVTIEFKSHGGKIVLMEQGIPVSFDEGLALKILQHKDIHVLIQLDEGTEEATAWGCDLSYEYVRINGDYRT